MQWRTEFNYLKRGTLAWLFAENRGPQHLAVTIEELRGHDYSEMNKILFTCLDKLEAC